MTSEESVYECSDGTPFRVHWEHEGDDAFPWELHQHHFPFLAPPLEIQMHRLSKPGRMAAFQEAGLQTPRTWRYEQWPHGFYYTNVAGANPASNVEDPETQQAAIVHLIERWGSPAGVWSDYCLPQIKSEAATLRQHGALWPLSEIASYAGRTWYRTQVALVAAGVAVRGNYAFLQEKFGDDPASLSYELAQGFKHPTMEADQALFDMAGLAASSEELRKYLLNTREPRTPEIDAIPGGRQFNQQFDAFLEEYGWRTESWQISAPTWRENPRIAFQSINRFLTNSGRSPQELVAEAAIRREELKATLMGRLSSEDSRTFEAIADGLSQLTRIREERAFWQLSLCGYVRNQILIRGEQLQAGGVIDEPQDVFFLLPDEIEGDPVDRRALVSERKDEHRYWSAKTPPMLIGTKSGPARFLSQPMPARLDEVAPETLRGLPSSKGVVIARALVATGFEDANRLEPGEVLVTKMTAPPWTPLFAVAGGVVTETGSILSHTAITAREYGIPCVVAVPSATSLIPDGSLIRVDGTNGLVEVLS